MEEIQWKAWIFHFVCGEPVVVVLGFEDEARRQPKRHSADTRGTNQRKFICPNAACESKAPLARHAAIAGTMALALGPLGIY